MTPTFRRVAVWAAVLAAAQSLVFTISFAPRARLVPRDRRGREGRAGSAGAVLDCGCDTVVDDIYKIDAAFKEMRLAMFPAIGRQLGKSPPEMDTYLHGNFPKTMAFLDAWDSELYQGAHDLSLSQIKYQDEFHNADATPYRTLPWLVMLPAAVLVVAAGLALTRKGELVVKQIT